MPLLLYLQLLDLVFVIGPSIDCYLLAVLVACARCPEHTSSCRLRGQEPYLSLQVFYSLLSIGREVGVIRQPNTAVRTGVPAWCLRHRECHSGGHWIVCGGHATARGLFAR